MSEIRAGHVIAFYLFDVASSVNLPAVSRLVGGPAVPARLTPKPSTPAYVQYGTAPLLFDGEAIGVVDPEGFRSRIRVYDYGVVSVALSRAFEGTWADLLTISQNVIESTELEQRAEQICRAVLARLTEALVAPRATFLSEDYVVFSVNELDRPLTADALLQERGETIAALLRGERQALSEQERTQILRHRISYLVDDLIIPTWNSALVYDTAAGVQASLEILEFANSQLLEYRHYDQQLDDELSRIYASLQHPKWLDNWRGRRYTQAALQTQALIIDVNELTDRTENTIKFIGDIYAVRVFEMVAERLGLDRWKAEVEAKLKTLDDIYRFAVEQSAVARGNFLELTIVLILILEFVLIMLGVMS